MLKTSAAANRQRPAFALLQGRALRIAFAAVLTVDVALLALVPALLESCASSNVLLALFFVGAVAFALAHLEIAISYFHETTTNKGDHL